jgi:hypothetical protein
VNLSIVTRCPRVCGSGAGSAVVVGDNFGRLKLMRCPCPDNEVLAKVYYGHGGAVRRVKWTANDSFVMSVGGEDRSLFQWRVVRDVDDESTPCGREAHVRAPAVVPRRRLCPLSLLSLRLP